MPMLMCGLEPIDSGPLRCNSSMAPAIEAPVYPHHIRHATSDQAQLNRMTEKELIVVMARDSVWCPISTIRSFMQPKLLCIILVPPDLQLVQTPLHNINSCTLFLMMLPFFI